VSGFKYAIIYVMKTIEALKSYLIESLPEAKIYLFGSRAKNKATPYSDVDIAIQSKHLTSKELSKIRFTIEEPNFPYKVDLIDLSKTPYLVKRTAKRVNYYTVFLRKLYKCQTCKSTFGMSC